VVAGGEPGVNVSVYADQMRKGTTHTAESRAKMAAVPHPTGPSHPGFKHGLTETPTWHSWANMIQRCTNPNNPAYDRYGGRGITVCDRWQGDMGFANFLADMGEKPAGTSVDRTDNERGYEPGNCRWATAREQAMNRRSHGVIVTKLSYEAAQQIRALRGQFLQREIAEQFGISRTMVSRILSGQLWNTPPS
jgi:hypothetical protein